MAVVHPLCPPVITAGNHKLASPATPKRPRLPSSTTQNGASESPRRHAISHLEFAPTVTCGPLAGTTCSSRWLQQQLVSHPTIIGKPIIKKLHNHPSSQGTQEMTYNINSTTTNGTKLVAEVALTMVSIRSGSWA